MKHSGTVNTEIPPSDDINVWQLSAIPKCWGLWTFWNHQCRRLSLVTTTKNIQCNILSRPLTLVPPKSLVPKQVTLSTMGPPPNHLKLLASWWFFLYKIIEIYPWARFGLHMGPASWADWLPLIHTTCYIINKICSTKFSTSKKNLMMFSGTQRKPKRKQTLKKEKKCSIRNLDFLSTKSVYPMPRSCTSSPRLHGLGHSFEPWEWFKRKHHDAMVSYPIDMSI